MSKSVILVSTSSATFNGNPTGVWLEEVAAPYYLFLEAGYKVTFASVTGGPVPIDQGSMGESFFTEHCKKFMHDAAAVGGLSHTTAIADCDTAGCDAIYIAGGHGCCNPDFYNDKALIAAIEGAIEKGKVVAADCHGPTVLASCKFQGKPIVSGVKVTAFSDSEEAAVGLTDKVDFLLQQKFVEQGGDFAKGDDWSPNAVSAAVGTGTLITGQNPQSSEAAANLVIAALK